MATSLLLGGCFLCVLGCGWGVGVARLCSPLFIHSSNTCNLPPGTGQRPFRFVRERARLQGRLPRLELLQAARSPAPETEELQKETRPSPRSRNHPPRPCLVRPLECKALLRPKRGYWPGCTG